MTATTIATTCRPFARPWPPSSRGATAVRQASAPAPSTPPRSAAANALPTRWRQAPDA